MNEKPHKRRILSGNFVDLMEAFFTSEDSKMYNVVHTYLEMLECTPVCTPVEYLTKLFTPDEMEMFKADEKRFKDDEKYLREFLVLSHTYSLISGGIFGEPIKDILRKLCETLALEIRAPHGGDEDEETRSPCMQTTLLMTLARYYKSCSAEKVKVKDPL